MKKTVKKSAALPLGPDYDAERDTIAPAVNLAGFVPRFESGKDELFIQMYKILESVNKGEVVDINEFSYVLESLEKELSILNFFKHQYGYESSLKRKLLFLDSRLTKTEIKICELLKSGLTCKDVARIMNLSTRTIETHRLNIRRKLKLKNKTNLDLFIINL